VTVGDARLPASCVQQDPALLEAGPGQGCACHVPGMPAELADPQDPA
jgi:hypothetical protein